MIAGHEPEGELRSKIDEALNEIAATINPELFSGEDPNMCLTGEVAENSVFVLPISVRLDSQSGNSVDVP